MVPRAIVRLALIWLAFGLPADAECFGPPMPGAIAFDDGSTLTLLTHTAQDVTFATNGPHGANGVATLRNGIFVTVAEAAGANQRYDWLDLLPALQSLQPGFTQRFQADMVVEHAARSFFTTDVTVLRQDMVVVAGCPYPVLVLDQTDWLNGQVQSHMLRWVSPDLRLPLRLESADPQRPFRMTAVDMK